MRLRILIWTMAGLTISTTGAVTTGNSIIVFVATDNSLTTITCPDPIP